MFVEDFPAKLIAALFVIMLSVSMTSLFSSGNITSYYFQKPNLYSTSCSEVQTYCVYGNINWRLDPVIGCSANLGETVMMMIALNNQNIKITQVSPDSVEHPKPLKEEKF